MYYWNSYPFVRYTAALILGILLFESNSSFWSCPGVGVLFLLLFFSSVTISHKYGFYRFRIVNGAFALIFLVYLGGYLTQTSYHNYPANHYRFVDENIRGFSGTIAGPVNERTNHYRYDLEMDAVITDSTQQTIGTIHLYIRKDSSISKPFSYGDNLLIKGSFYPVPGPDNPEEFNYKLYLERQGILCHSFVQKKDVKKIHHHPSSKIFNLALNIREKATKTIDQYVPAKRENAISKALILGIKDYLENDVKKAYSSAGAMHVLAVSGLHVGIIFLILQVILGKLTNYGMIGRISFGMLSVSIIWIYAMITGLSPSVLRAATMFSIISLGSSFSKDSNIYNTLGIAAFILLIIDPYLIYSVGFQLSFVAVIGIVYLQPKLYRLFSSRYWLVDKIWSITCVSIAAQLATFPLSAYYFHQFPTYFLVSNLIVIPGAFLLLILGIIMISADFLMPTLAHLLGYLLSKIMWVMNEIIEIIEKLPHSLIEWIYLDRVGLILVYIIVLTLISGFHFRSIKTLVLSMLVTVVFNLSNVFSHFNQSEEELVLFYEIKNKTVIDHIKGHHSTLYIDEYDTTEMELLSFQINPNRLANHLEPIESEIRKLKNGADKKEILPHIIGGHKLLIIDTTTFHLTISKKIDTDILLINNGAIKSLQWLQENFIFNHLIIGNRNSRYYSAKIKNQAAELGITIHSLKEDGAYTINLGHKKRADMQPALFTTNPD